MYDGALAQQREGGARREKWAQLAKTSVEIDDVASFSHVHIQM